MGSNAATEPDERCTMIIKHKDRKEATRPYQTRQWMCQSCTQAEGTQHFGRRPKFFPQSTEQTKTRSRGAGHRRAPPTFNAVTMKGTTQTTPNRRCKPPHNPTRSNMVLYVPSRRVLGDLRGHHGEIVRRGGRVDSTAAVVVTAGDDDHDGRVLPVQQRRRSANPAPQSRSKQSDNPAIRTEGQL